MKQVGSIVVNAKQDLHAPIQHKFTATSSGGRSGAHKSRAGDCAAIVWAQSHSEDAASQSTNPGALERLGTAACTRFDHASGTHLLTRGHVVQADNFGVNRIRLTVA